MVNDARGTLLQVREQVQSELTSYLSLQREYLSSIGSELIPVCDALESFLLEGGKRLRPLFAYAGFAATGKVATPADIRAFTSLELLQACALIHDDLMDRSDTRRGKPAIHRHFENLHQEDAMNGLADQFGEAAAILHEPARRTLALRCCSNTTIHRQQRGPRREPLHLPYGQLLHRSELTH